MFIQICHLSPDLLKSPRLNHHTHCLELLAHGFGILPLLRGDVDLLLLRDARVLFREVVHQRSPDQAPQDTGASEKVED